MIKKEVNSQKISLLLIILIFLILMLFNVKSQSGDISKDNLDVQVNESGVYEWQVKNPGSIKSLKASGSVSSNGTARVYIEKNGTRYLLFDSTKQLFDVDINVLPEYKKIFQGDKILIQNILFNLRGFGAGSVDVKYSIKDIKGNLIATEEEAVYVETQAKFVRELLMPAEIKAGTYTAFVEASANGTIVGSGSDTFEVQAKYQTSYYQQVKFYIIAASAVAAFIIAIIFMVYGTNLLKKKKAIAEMKEKKPLEKAQKLEKELKALEEAHKSGFISEESYQKEKKRIEERLRISRK